MKQKKYVYAAELNDDFAASRGKIKRKKIDAGYKYIHKSAIWKTASFVIYRMIATPLGYISMRVFKGLKIKNRKALGKVKGGFFLYGNHTQGWGDAFAPTLACFPEKVHVVVGAEAVSLPVVGHVAHMAGGMPLPSDLGGMRNFMSAMKKFVQNGEVIAIYPEAHIWPYYNKIRPFSEASFSYPLMMKAPVIAFTVTYRQRKIFKNFAPCVTVTLSDPFMPEDYPDKKQLRDGVYRFMTETVEKENSYAYRTYVKKEQVENYDSV